ncbi:MAG TPA: DMT family transporter [Plasticicumulans sp.]|nr:DMT family transporter [Plasticicumulans sp.]
MFPPSASPAHRAFVAAMPALFVLLWSTGFIGAKLGLPHAEPFTFLAIRMLIATALLAALAFATAAPWPRTPAEAARIALAGLLKQAGYLGGVFYAIGTGLPAGITALIVGFQPLLTAALAGPLLGERVTRAQWAGLGLGLIGIVLVLAGREHAAGGQITPAGIASALLALLTITFGTVWQKRHCGGMDLRTGGVVQYGASALALGALAFAFETRIVDWTPAFAFALGWLVLVLSVGAVGLLYTLIRRGEVARVGSLFYLTPPVTALMAWAMFGERLGAVAILGMALVAGAVWLANRGPR